MQTPCRIADHKVSTLAAKLTGIVFGAQIWASVGALRSGTCPGTAPGVVGAQFGTPAGHEVEYTIGQRSGRLAHLPRARRTVLPS